MADRDQPSLAGAPDEPLGGGAGDEERDGLQQAPESSRPQPTTVAAGDDITTDDLYHADQRDGRRAPDREIVEHVRAELDRAAARVRHHRSHTEDPHLCKRLDRTATTLAEMARAYQTRAEPGTSPPR